MAKTSLKVKQGRKAKFKIPCVQPLPPLWPAARLLPQVRPLPDLPARGRARGLHPRHDQVELVENEKMLTDPIADYLTRIRNALGSGHDEVEIPASRLKLEMSRILKEQGYILDFDKQPAAVGEAIKIRLKYTEDRRPGDPRPGARSRAPVAAATSTTSRCRACTAAPARRSSAPRLA